MVGSFGWPIRKWLLWLLLLSISTSYGQSIGQVKVTILDAETSKPTPVRVRLTQNGHPVAQLPAEAIAVMYGLWDHEDGYGFQPDSSFYIAGRFRVSLPPGTYELTLSKGSEYLRQTHRLVVTAGKTIQKTIRLERWINMAAKGWYSTDGHIHLRRSPRDNPYIATWLQAEDVHVGAFLRMGDFWETYYPQYAYGDKGVYQQGAYLLTSGQEDPRTSELGHVFALGAADRVRKSSRYYFFDEVFDKIHQLGGITGYAHQAETFHGYRGLTLDGLRGKVDAFELLQFCVDAHPLHTQHYYHLLDLGIPLTATAGSDFPWCGQDHGHGPVEHSSRIGNARFYSYLGTDQKLAYSNWRDAVAAGHTFVSSGPVLDLRVANAIPGDHLDVKKGTSVSVTVHAYGHDRQVPLDTLELVSHGKVIGRVTARDAGQSPHYLSLQLTLPPLKSGCWMAARCSAGPGQAAHTTPVYLTVDGDGFYNRETASHYLDLSEQYLTEIEQQFTPDPAKVDQQAWKYKDGLQARITETRRIIDALRKKLK
ncbi:CehA/McbA family metallohydrolase [Spirosoma panaciterrae]|uniref:CehA/McbA family metallohydrolase n=1 Tax=Spirosoma panaciterrae TaxID=496058 RepID=UPI000365295B|nr:CehA/McbA family metallohydrolase [Spirosoma panaciterrae]